MLATQAAIWYLKSDATLADFNAKFAPAGLNQTEWEKAIAIANRCRATK
jgi:hypothetical protein